LASLEQEQRLVGNKLEQVKAMVDRAKSEHRNAQTNLNKLQRNELSLKQVNVKPMFFFMHFEMFVFINHMALKPDGKQPKKNNTIYYTQWVVCILYKTPTDD